MIKAITLDDNQQDLNCLNELLQKMEGVHLQASFTNSINLLSYFEKNQVHLLFADIKMKGLNGLELLKKISCPPLLVFVTAYPEYALDSFQFDPLHYIVKPISEVEVRTAVERARIRLENLSLEGFVILKSGYGAYHKVLLKNIFFIESDGDYLKVQTNEGEIRVYERLKNFKKRLPPSFVQTHRSYIVNSEHVKSIVSNVVYLSDYRVPISRLYKKQVETALLNDIWQRN